MKPLVSLMKKPLSLLIRRRTACLESLRRPKKRRKRRGTRRKLRRTRKRRKKRKIHLLLLLRILISLQKVEAWEAEAPVTWVVIEMMNSGNVQNAIATDTQAIARTSAAGIPRNAMSSAIDILSGAPLRLSVSSASSTRSTQILKSTQSMDQSGKIKSMLSVMRLNGGFVTVLKILSTKATQKCLSNSSTTCGKSATLASLSSTTQTFARHRDGGRTWKSSLSKTSMES